MNQLLNILIADDHRMFAQTMTMIFERAGITAQVDIVKNGKEAIDQCLTKDYDLAVLDVNMPLIDGIEALKEILRHRPGLKVLMVTMLTEYEKLLPALEAGARGVVSKRADVNELIKAIRAILNGKLVIPTFLEDYLQTHPKPKGKFQQESISVNELISKREKAIIKLITEGLTDTEIAAVLSISPMTAKTHRKNLLAKLKLRNTAQLVRFAVENKLV
jgi:two-component system invasion response regulator UvrY